MKILTILGERPQFVKAGAVSRAIRYYNKNILEDYYFLEMKKTKKN